MTAELTGLAPPKSVAFAVYAWACHHSGQPCPGLQPLGALGRSTVRLEATAHPDGLEIPRVLEAHPARDDVSPPRLVPLTCYHLGNGSQALGESGLPRVIFDCHQLHAPAAKLE